MAAKKKRSPAQIAATKKMLAANKAAKKGTTKKAVKKTAKKTAKKVAKKVAKKTAKKTAKKVAKKTATRVATRVAKKVVKKACPPARKKAAKKKTAKKRKSTMGMPSDVVKTRTMPDGSKWHMTPKGNWVATKGPKKSPKRKAAKKRAAKKSTPRKSTKKAPATGDRRVVTMKDIIAGAVAVPKGANVTAKWICAGPKRTGCGGGKAHGQGSRVIGHL